MWQRLNFFIPFFITQAISVIKQFANNLFTFMHTNLFMLKTKQLTSNYLACF